MKRFGLLSMAAVAFGAAFMASATTHYVDLSSATPASPYLSWATAATNIQDAVDAGVDGDDIVVTNGLYATGGRVVYGAMTNRLAINKAMNVHSISGPLLTIIQGLGVGTWGTNNGEGAIRCVYVGSNAVLSGFTLTNGHTRAAGDAIIEQTGGGAWCEMSGVVSNCTLIGNFAYWAGGGSYGGALKNCAVNTNSASQGGGVCSNALNNCTLTGNYASGAGGGASGSTLTNCTVSTNWTSLYGGGAAGCILSNCALNGNWAYAYGGGACSNTLINCNLTGNYSAGSTGGGAYSSTLNNCVLSRNSAYSGGGAGGGTLNNCTLSANSASVYGGGAAGSTLNNCTLCGNWGSFVPSYGGGAYASTLNNCIVYYHDYPATSPNYYQCTLNYCCTTPLPSGGIGNITNVPLFMNTNGWTNLRLQSNSPCINSGNNAYAPGPTDLDGNPRLSGGFVDIGAYEFQNPPVITHYVNPNNAKFASPPYTSWTSAATNIQDAVDAAGSGDLVLVTNGLYATAGRVVYGAMTNRVAINKALTVRSVNGAQMTTIRGIGVGPHGDRDGDGAIRCVYLGINAMLSGFTLTNGYTRATGDTNYEQSGGGVWCESSGVLSNCILSGNSAYNYGGGAYSGKLYNCILSGNSAAYGGGAYSNTLNNCTLAGNFATYGGGAYSNWLNNCIVYYNSAPISPNYSAVSTLNYCCTTPFPGGTGNITNVPVFVNVNGWANLRLQSNSPCINAGNNTYMPGLTDLDGRPRVVGGTVDIGAYEFQPAASGAFIGWLQSYGLPTDGSADYSDPDGDGMNNWQEWVAGTNPTNAASFLQLLSAKPSATNVVVTWLSVNTRTYSLARGTNLSIIAPLSVTWSNIVGLAGTTSFTDTNPPSGNAFYRVAVQPP